MSKFCTSCGASLDDNATFCTSCGAQLGGNQQQQATPNAAGNGASATDAMKNTFNNIKGKVDIDAIKGSLSKENIMSLKSNPNKTTLIVLGTIIILAIIILIILFNVIFAHPYKSAISNCFNGMTQGDSEKYLKSVPQCQIDYIEDNMCGSDGNYDDAEDYFSNTCEKMQEYFEDEYGDDVKISFSVKKEKKLSDKKLDTIKDNLKEVYDAKGIKVTKGYDVTLDVKIKGDDDKDDDTLSVTVAKVDGDWCVVSSDLTSLASLTSTLSSYSDYLD